MANPLERANRSALKTNDRIGELFAQVGSNDHPNGFVMAAYRQAYRALKTALGEEQALLAARDVMNTLKRNIQTEARGLIADARALGAEEAARQLSLYGIKNTSTIVPTQVSSAERSSAALDAIMSKVDAQSTLIRAAMLTTSDASLILGTSERMGILRASEITSVSSDIAAKLVWSEFSMVADQAIKTNGLEFSKQVVAALDDRTTDCCLKAHGQIQPMDEPFKLTGTPRYADELDWAPFHWYCRTSISLYLPEFDMGLTDEMRAGANQIITEREQGGSGARYPVDAYT